MKPSVLQCLAMPLIAGKLVIDQSPKILKEMCTKLVCHFLGDFLNGREEPTDHSI